MTTLNDWFFWVRNEVGCEYYMFVGLNDECFLTIGTTRVETVGSCYLEVRM